MALKQIYNDVVNYFLQQQQRQKEPNESDEMPHLARINRISSLLKDSNYLQIHREQICMFYSTLIKEYRSARTTLNLPKFLYQPPIYIQKVIFSIPLTINTGKIYCILELIIIFPEELDKNIPEFYIKNPDYNKYKPNKAHVKFSSNQQQGKKYQAVMGGLRILLPQSSNERWQWTAGKYYKQQNIANMVRWIHKFLLLDHFPFAARKKEKYDTIESQAKALAQFLKKVTSSQSTLTQSPLLDNIQDLDALRKNIQLETSILKNQIINFKNIEKQSQLYQIEQFLPTTKDNLSQSVLQSVSTIQAIKDTLDLFQHKFMDKQVDLNEFMQFVQVLSKKQFDERVKMSQNSRVELL